jgi:GH24 family phage-related lysozyme (muramidase)
MDFDEAFDLLQEDLPERENSINGNVKVQLYQVQFDALVDFVYNIGTGPNRFPASQLLKNITDEKCDAATIRAGFLGWLNPPSLLNRRNAEINEFNSWPTNQH